MRTDYINKDDYNKLYSLMSYENVLAIRVSLETGLRIGDVVALPAEALKGRTVSYTASKTGKSGKAVLSADLARRLSRISGRYYIFEHRTDIRKHRARQTVWKDVKNAFLRLVDRGEFAGVNVAPHSARKTAAVEEFHEHGLTAAQKMLQHSRMDNTMLYAFSDMMIGGKNVKQMFDSEEIAQIFSCFQSLFEKIDLLILFVTILLSDG